MRYMLLFFAVSSCLMAGNWSRACERVRAVLHRLPLGRQLVGVLSRTSSRIAATTLSRIAGLQWQRSWLSFHVLSILFVFLWPLQLVPDSCCHVANTCWFRCLCSGATQVCKKNMFRLTWCSYAWLWSVVNVLPTADAGWIFINFWAHDLLCPRRPKPRFRPLLRARSVCWHGAWKWDSMVNCLRIIWQTGRPMNVLPEQGWALTRRILF